MEFLLCQNGMPDLAPIKNNELTKISYHLAVWKGERGTRGEKGISCFLALMKFTNWV